MQRLPLYEGCFVCGNKNSSGLQAVFWLEAGEAKGKFTPDSRWEGYPGIVHGGVLTSLLDEVMYKAISPSGELAMTAEITVRFRNPARVGVTLYPSGRVVRRRGRLVEAEGEIRDALGRLIAAATAKFIVLPPEGQESLMKAMEGRIHC